MLSTGKQIALGIFTVIGFSVLATLALGKTFFVDTYEFAEEKPILLCAVYVLYFAVFVIYAALAKRKNLEVLAKTTIIFGAVLAFVYLIAVLGSEIVEYGDGVLVSLLYAFTVVFINATYPLYLVAGSFVGSDEEVAMLVGSIMLFAAPIIAGIIYLLTKKPVAMEEADTQDNETQLNVELDT